MNDETRRSQSSPVLTAQTCGTSSLLQVAWADARLSPASDPAQSCDVFYTRKLARGSAWSSNLRVSDVSSFKRIESCAASPVMAVAPGGALAAWTDRRDSTDARDFKSDVYTSRILSGVSCR
ncbi:MAG: hypothetical protein U1E42_04160 [Rhodospirillales bacterium]